MRTRSRRRDKPAIIGSARGSTRAQQIIRGLADKEAMPRESQVNDPIFLLGNPRSGTSLLSRMLNAHPRICVPFESHIYNIFWPYRESYEPLTDPGNRERLIRDALSMRVFRDWADPPDVEEVIAGMTRHDFHGAFDSIMKTWARGQNKPRWGDKTPQYGPFWDVLYEGFPNAKFVHLVRDGRDSSMSLVKARFGPKLIYPAARRWATYIDLMNDLEKTVGPEQFHLIKYEDLLQDSEAELRKLCAFLGEPYDPAMLRYHEQKDAYMSDRRNRANLKKPLIKDNSGKWERLMPTRHQRVVEAVARNQLKQFGYPLKYPEATVSKWRHLRDTRLLHPPLRVLAMLRNPKGWGDGLVRLGIRLRQNRYRA